MFQLKTNAPALMGAASPDLEKQGFLAVVFVNREFSRKPDRRERPNYDFYYNLK